MREYTFSKARQELAGLLDEARRSGSVLIRRRDGQVFEVRPAVQGGRSPLDVPGINVALPAGELLSALAESRASGQRFVRKRPSKRAKPR
ncbi:MAG: type II toxin-antitoxin system Phd/YefM family antitoxin [Gemmatimonadaceae bacterium]